MNQAAIASAGALMQVGFCVSVGIILSKRGTLKSAHSKLLGGLCKDCFLPCLLLAEVGKGVTLKLLLEWWPVPLAALSFVFIGGKFAQILWNLVCFVDVTVFKSKELPKEIPSFALAAAAFPVTTSVPVALLKALPFQLFVIGDESVDQVVSEMHAQATSIVLLYTLFMTLLRWTYGFQLLAAPSLMNNKHNKSSNDESFSSLLSDKDLKQKTCDLNVDETSPVDDQDIHNSKFKTNVQFYKEAVLKSFDTPVIACLIGITIGVIPFLKQIFYGKLMQPFIGAISWIGAGYVPSVMLILGQELYDGLTNKEEEGGDVVDDEAQDCDHKKDVNDNRTTNIAVVVTMLTRLIIVPLCFFAFVSMIWQFQTSETDLGTIHEKQNIEINNGTDDDNVSTYDHEIYRTRAALALVLLVESCGPAAIILVVMCSLQNFQKKEMAKVMLFSYPVGFATLLLWTTMFMSLLVPPSSTN